MHLRLGDAGGGLLAGLAALEQPLRFLVVVNPPHAGPSPFSTSAGWSEPSGSSASIERSTFRPSSPRQAAGREVIDTGFDYSSTDTILPHPSYAPMHWIAVVDAGKRTGIRLASLIEQAHTLTKSHYGRAEA